MHQNLDSAITKKLTWPRLDLNCWAAPDVLLHLRHALPGRLVGIVCGANCDLVLNAALALQVIPALPVWRRKEEREDFMRVQAYKFPGSAQLTDHLSNTSIRDSRCHKIVCDVDTHITGSVACACLQILVLCYTSVIKTLELILEPFN